MASRVALVLLLNIIFFILVSSSYDVPCPPPPPSTLKDHNGHEYPPPTYNTVTCPMDALKLKVCANVLNLVDVFVGPKSECCALIKDLVDLEAAICLCTALKANVLGINLNVPLSLSLVLNHCGKNVPSDFQCA